MPRPEKNASYYITIAQLGEYAAAVEEADGHEVGGQLFARLGDMALRGDTPAEYNQWAEQSASTGRDIEIQAELLRAYDEKFAGPIAELRKHLAGPDAPRPFAVTPSVRVHVIEVEGKKYAVRFMDWRFDEVDADYEPLSPGYMAHDYMKHLYGARGLTPKLEQLEGVSPVDGTTVARFIESVPFTTEVMQKVPDEHIDGLLDTAEIMWDNYLYPDAENKSNLPYHPDGGFHVIDFYTYGSDIRLGDIIGELAPGLVAPSRDENYRHKPLSPHGHAVRVAFLDRVLERARMRYADTDPETLLEIEHHCMQFRQRELGPALARWHAEHGSASSGRTGQAERSAAQVTSMSEVKLALGEAASIISDVYRGVYIEVRQLQDIHDRLQVVWQDSGGQSDDIMRAVATAVDHLSQVNSHLQESWEALNSTIHE